MKIAINGDIVDTKDIWKITKIKYGYYDYDEDISWFVDSEDKEFDPTHESISTLFIIKLFNKKSVLIEDKDPVKIKIIYDNLMKIWMDNKSNIPQFNI